MGYNRGENIRAAKKKLKDNFLIAEPFEWTEKQTDILTCMLHKHTKCVFIDGCAGTGKTVLAVYSALIHLQRQLISKIYYVRSVVESAHSKMGYLPGNADEKLAPFGEVLIDAMNKFLTPEEIIGMVKSKKIETIPLSFLRGRDLQNCIVIADESQNIFFDEMVTIATRIGSNELGETSKLFVLGDTAQSDLPSQYKKDYLNFLNLFNDDQSKEFGIHNYVFDEDDVKRSEFVKFVVKKIKEYRNKRS